ncbi:hypothetical protein O181_082699 [Austropuccinia psidii MF-1]|uniref:Uncharacterized protein n=1 Tax=Austropuccinia psidii MF-1 TaxID=1389203 RepID=A0A9Q3FPS6_9BASI|nr:hypothetical protein [Austropuccinia psidii MF-1]
MTSIPLFLLDSVEENYIPLETQSQDNTPVTPSEPEGSKGKGKRHNEGLITAKKRTPIATQRNRKPQNSASIKGKPTLTTCTGKITIINPVVTSKRKLPKSADNIFVQGTFKGTNQRTEMACPEPEDLEEDTLNTEGNHTHSAIPFPIQQEPQIIGLERHGSSSSAPPTPQRFISILHRQQGVKSSIPLGRTWSKLPEDFPQRDILQRPYGNQKRLDMMLTHLRVT